jgi:hypothetical protein
VLPHRLSSPYALIPYDLRGGGAPFEKALFLDNPSIAKHLDVLRPELALGVSLLRVHSYHVTACALQNDLISDLRLNERLRDGALHVFPPDLARTVTRLESHEI